MKFEAEVNEPQGYGRFVNDQFAIERFWYDRGSWKNTPYYMLYHRPSGMFIQKYETYFGAVDRARKEAGLRSLPKNLRSHPEP